MTGTGSDREGGKPAHEDIAAAGAPPSEAREHGAPQAAAEAELALPDDALIIVPVRHVVLFPSTLLPLAIDRARAQAGVQKAVRDERPIGILLQNNPDIVEPTPSDLFSVGTSAAVLRYVTAPDGSHHAVARGLRRFRVLAFLDGYPFDVARVAYVDEPKDPDAEIEGRGQALKQRALETLQYLPQAPQELAQALQAITDPAQLADVICSLLDDPPPDKQSLLETLDLKTRLDRLLSMLARRIEVLKVSRDVSDRTRESIGDMNRKHLLREQMRTIQKELGEDDTGAAELAQLEQAIGDAHMPEAVQQVARKELKRLQHMPEAAGEYAMIRSYLDWLIEMPWEMVIEPAIDIADARRILDEDHFGLDKVKRRILEFLAVRKLNPAGASPILCFVGPPGVGKTSLGHSIAKATGRKFARVSLGGVHDEAEIRGHRRTYIGALPGNVIQNIHKVQTRNCVLMFDEVDKLGAGGFHGDPSSALLEVLDPEQNNTFRDNYLAVPFDLSQVMFICTANMLDTIPGPLRDRMEVIQLPGYTQNEKLQIALRYLLPRQLAAAGVSAEQCRIDDAVLMAVIGDYTREAGVRNLEREIGNVVRNVAVRIADGSKAQVHVTTADLATILGPQHFESDLAMRSDIPGVATGLAWTPVGGEILFIEAARTPGNGRLVLTGQLGEVMKESAQAALSLIKGRAAMLGVDPGVFDKTDIHVHVPAGATPKDGPSAGVAMVVALTSLMSNRPVRADVAMTGEISLRGLVLPIGGVKEKVLAALRAGIDIVLLPARNRRDLDEIPPDARARLRLVWLEHVDDAIRVALGSRETPIAAPASPADDEAGHAQQAELPLVARAVYPP